MPFERTKFRELLMQSCDVFRIGQGIAATNLAALDRRVQGWAKHDVVDREVYPPERFKEPGADDAVHNDELATTCVASRDIRQNIDHHPILLICLRKIGWDRAVLDKMPEVVGVEMHFRRSVRHGHRGGRCSLSRAWRSRQDENFLSMADHCQASLTIQQLTHISFERTSVSRFPQFPLS